MTMTTETAELFTGPEAVDNKLHVRRSNTIRDKVDEIIDWYETYKPRDGQTIPVTARPGTLRKFAKKERGGPYRYRDRVLVPTRQAITPPWELHL